MWSWLPLLGAPRLLTGSERLGQTRPENDAGASWDAVQCAVCSGDGDSPSPSSDAHPTGNPDAQPRVLELSIEALLSPDRHEVMMKAGQVDLPSNADREQAREDSRNGPS